MGNTRGAQIHKGRKVVAGDDLDDLLLSQQSGSSDFAECVQLDRFRWYLVHCTTHRSQNLGGRRTDKMLAAASLTSYQSF